MAQQFNLTAQINLQSPKNVGKVVSDIQRQLKGSGLNTVNIKVKADPRSLAQTNKQLQNVGKNSKTAAKNINTLNRSLQEATRRFSVITLATGSLLSFVAGIKNSTKAAIEFERELIKISQVTGKSVQQLQGLTKEVTRLSTAFGVSSADLLNVSRTLAQAGFNAEQTRKSLDILAKTTLAATFDNIQDTTEGAIALLRQFGNEAKSAGGDVAFLEKSLDAINSVSKKFAVESGDLITVIRRVGGVFSAAGGSVNELIALFTSVRATTRESAETIATGLRTIFTRIQRTETIQQLKALNIQLQDSQGQFVGAFEAVKRLSRGLAGLDPRDFRFSQIVEQLGGFRQIGKVIPLVQQFATAQQALNVAQGASGSTAKDALTAQQGLGVQIQKVREEFTALIRKFSDSGPFNTIATGALKIANAMIKVAEAVEPLLPLLTTMFGLKLGRALAPGLGQLAGIGRSGRGGGAGFSRFARGGIVPGSGNRDTVPAMLTPGEFVIKKSSVKSLGTDTLQTMNQNKFRLGKRIRKSLGEKTPAKVGSTFTTEGAGSVTITDRVSDVALSELASDKAKYGGAFLRPTGAGKIVEGKLDAGVLNQALYQNPKIKDLMGRGATKAGIQKELKQINQAVAGKGQYGFDLHTGALSPEKSTQLEETILSGVGAAVKRGASQVNKKMGRSSKLDAGSLAGILKSSNIDNVVGNVFESVITALGKKNPYGDRDSNADFDYPSGLQGERAALFKLTSVAQDPTDAKSTFSGPNLKTFLKKVKNFETKKSANEVINRLGPTLGLISATASGGTGSNEDLRLKLAKAYGEKATSQNQGLRLSDLTKQFGRNVSQQEAFSLGAKKASSSGKYYFNKGGRAPSDVASSDTIPAMLTPGEFVVNKEASKRIGYDNLNRMNKQGVQGYAAGGVVTTGRNNYGISPIAKNIVAGNANTGRNNYRISPMAQNIVAGNANVGGVTASSGPQGVDMPIASNKELDESLKRVTKNIDKSGESFQKLEGSLDSTKVGADKLGPSLNRTSKGYLDGVAAYKKSQSALSKLGSAYEKAKSKFASTGAGRALSGGPGGGRQAALGGIDKMAGAAQSFVFLGAMVGSVTSQMSSLDAATKQAVNETAAFVTGIVGIGGTLVQTFTSMASASAQSAIADNLEAGSSEKAAAANASAGGKLATGLGVAALAVVAVIAVLKYFSAKAKADADQISKTRKKEIDEIKKTGKSSVDTGELQKGLEKELALRQESAVLGSKSMMAAAGSMAASGAIAGAAAGSLFPVVGTAIGGILGGVAGGLAGYLVATSNATNAVDAATEARIKEAQSTREVYEAQIQLAQSTYGLTSSLADIESTRGLTDSQKIAKRLDAQQTGAGESIGITSDIKAKTSADAKTLGISEAKLSTMSEEEIRSQAAKGDDYFSDAVDENTTNAIVQRSAVAFETLADASNLAALRVSETGKTLGTAMSALQIGDSKAAIESQKQFAQATVAARNAIKDETATKLASIDPTLKGAELKKAENEINEKGNTKLALFNQGVVSVIKAKQAEQAAIERATKAQIAVARALQETDKFLNKINNIEINLDRQSEAMDNFAAVIDNAALKVKASGVDEIGDVGNVKDINKFANQVSNVTAGFGPQARKVGSELAQSASIIKNARSLIGKNFSIGDPIDPKEILNGLGLTSGLVGKDIFNEISTALQSSEGVIKEEDIAAIFGPLEELSQKNAEVVKRLVGVNQKEIDNYQKYLDIKEKLRNREVEQKTKEIEALQEGLKLRQQADALVRKSQGLSEDPATAARQTRSQNTAARNSRNQAQLQGITVGGKQVNAQNVGQVAAIRAKAIRERGQIQQSIAGGDSSKELIKRQKQLQVVIGSTTKVLENFADSGEKAQDIFTEMEANISVIEKERQKREQMLAVVEEFVVGGEDARKNLVMASKGIRQAFAVGSLQMQSPEQRQATVGLLDQLSDVVLMGGMTGQQIKQELVVRDAIRMGLDPNIAKQLATATTTEQKLIQANKNLALEVHQLTLETINSRKALADPKPAGGKATGGLVQYRAGGGTIFKPKGTDTVPAMLTPGEFVIRKSAVDKIGADNLAAMNRGGSVIYRHGGGETDSKGNKVFHQHRTRRMNDDDMISGPSIGKGLAHQPFDANDRPIQKQDGTPPGIPQTATGYGRSDRELGDGGGGAGFSGSSRVQPPIVNSQTLGDAPTRNPGETDSSFKRRQQEFFARGQKANKYAYRDQGFLSTSKQMQYRVDKRHPYAQAEPPVDFGVGFAAIGEGVYNTLGFIGGLFSSGEPAAKPASTARRSAPVEYDPNLNAPGMPRTSMPPMPTMSPVDERVVDVSGQLGLDLVDIKPPNLTKASATPYEDLRPDPGPAYISSLQNASLQGLGIDQFEIWTDNTGKFKTQAKYRGISNARSGGNAILNLEKDNGTTVGVPQNRLSKQSMDLARKYYKILGYAKGGPVYRAFGGGIGYGGGGYGPGNTGQMQAARGNQYMMQQYQQGNQFMNQRRQSGMNFMNNMRNQALSYTLSGPRNQAHPQAGYKAIDSQNKDIISPNNNVHLNPMLNRMVRQGQANAIKRMITDPKGEVRHQGPYRIVGVDAHAKQQQQQQQKGMLAPGVRGQVVQWLVTQQKKGFPLGEAIKYAEKAYPQLNGITNQEKKYAKSMFQAGMFQNAQAGNNQGPQNQGGVQPLGQFARGGIVPSYFSSGGMNSDSVPAMLTPGEFVMSQDAVKKHGVAAMKSLNQGQVPGFNRGGVVGGVQYRQDGGGILGNMASGAAKMMGLDTSEMGSLFDNFVGSFSKTLDNLTSPLTLLAASMNNLADKFGNFTMTHKVEISGLPDIDANLLGNQLGESIAKNTVEKVQSALDENNNNFNIA